jgi:hypothetical protein
MVDSKVSEWVREGLKKGYSKERLRQELLKKGYSGKDTENALKEKTRKNILLIIVPILVILVITALVTSGFIQNQKQIKQIKDELNECNNSLAGVCKAIFQQTSDKELSVYSYGGQAVRENNISLCNKTGDEYFCRAYILNNLSFCNELSPSICNYENSTLCEKERAKAREDCKVFIKSRTNSSECLKLSSPLKEICLAFSTNNIELCSQVADSCKNVFATKYYMITNNNKYCSSITNDKYRACCENALTGKSCLKTAYNFFYTCLSDSNKEFCGGLE